MQDIKLGQVLVAKDTHHPLQTFNTGARFVVCGIVQRADGSTDYEVMDSSLDPESTCMIEPWLLPELEPVCSHG